MKKSKSVRSRQSRRPSPKRFSVPVHSNSFTAVVSREGRSFVALCPELDVASQGANVEKATANLKEAVELFLECADEREIRRRRHSEVFVTRFEASRP